jgi:hypothetical protein
MGVGIFLPQFYCWIEQRSHTVLSFTEAVLVKKKSLFPSYQETLSCESVCCLCIVDVWEWYCVLMSDLKLWCSIVFGNQYRIAHLNIPSSVRQTTSKFVMWGCWQILSKMFESYELWGVVGVVIAYRLDDCEVGVWVPVRSRIFASPCHPDLPWDYPNFLVVLCFTETYFCIWCVCACVRKNGGKVNPVTGDAGP